MGNTSMKVLIIGAAGFVGGYLIRHLNEELHWNVIATKLPQESISSIPSSIEVFDLDILNKDNIFSLLKTVHPDAIIHLAAQSSVRLSWDQPDLTVDINIKGTLHILDSIRSLDYNPRLLLIGSGEEYGHIMPTESPLKESNPIRPGNIYAATKACQNMLGKIYADAYKMDIMSVRSFNHIGPNQSPLFVVSDFCKQVAEIEVGKKSPIIYVGNLSSARDFLDVRDVVRAYALLLQYGISGETYNVGSGHAIKIEKILEKILSYTTVPIQIETDLTKFRPVDVPIIEADTTKLRQCTGWTPTLSIDDTILDVLNYWRKNII